MSDNTYQPVEPPGGISLKIKLIIVSVIVLLGLAAVYLPSQFAKAPEITAFKATPNPQAAYNNALKGDKPLFVEFYAKW